MYSKIFISISLVLLLACGSKFKQSDNKINGISFVAPSTEQKNFPFKDIVNIHSNWVAIMPYAFCKPSTCEIIFNHSRQWWGERDDGVIESIIQAKNNHLNVMLKPHIWVEGQGWNGDFDTDDNGWDKWEKDYATYILHYAKIADSLQIDLFCLGVENRKSVQKRNQFWLKLITEVKKVYSGKLTYASNWDNYQNVQFWNKLDYIGVDSYFPLVNENTPTIKQLNQAWMPIKDDLKKASEKYSKQVLFTEFGYRSIDKACWKQWEIPDDHHKNDGVPNFEVQNNGYNAIFQTFWGEKWFAGGFVWKWFDFEVDGEYNTGFTPQNKPVENVLMNNFNRNEP